MRIQGRGQVSPGSAGQDAKEWGGVCNRNSMTTQTDTSENSDQVWLAPTGMCTLNRMTSGLSYGMRWREKI